MNKLIMTCVAVASMVAVNGMGSRTKQAEAKPDDCDLQAPLPIVPVRNEPVKLIENTTDENAKIHESLNQEPEQKAVKKKNTAKKKPSVKAQPKKKTTAVNKKQSQKKSKAQKANKRIN